MVDFNVRPPVETPMYDESGTMTRAWQEFFSTLGDKLDSALTYASVGSDAVSVDTPAATAGTDSIDMSALNTELSTLATQINAIVTVINNLKDSLVQTSLMTE